MVGGALDFLAAVGEDIQESIPQKALHDGDIIQIQHEVCQSDPAKSSDTANHMLPKFDTASIKEH